MYDKDTDKNTDMNYDDINEEGIPPYDLPDFYGTDVPEPTKQEIKSEQVSPEPVQEINLDSIDTNTPDLEELSLSNMSEQNFQAEQPANEAFGDDINSPDNMPIQETNHKKGEGSKILIIVTILLFVILLPISLLVVYADNIPFLSSMIAKIHGKNSTKIVEVNENDLDLSGQTEETTGNEEIDSELQSLLGESGEDTGVEVTRNDGNNIPAGPVAAPDMPIGMNNMPQNGNSYPSLPNANNQKADFNNFNEPNVIQPYSRNIGRLDPFNPSGGTNQMFDIIVPPTNPTPDEKAQQLMALKISGIMYTADSPSAIINIAGSDQLVRKGDKFNGFSVEKITKDKVTVKAGANVYTASVGEILNIEQVGVNSIPNLNKKFGGPYSKGSDRIIEINMLE